jgi:hypothetical protein
MSMLRVRISSAQLDQDPNYRQNSEAFVTHGTRTVEGRRRLQRRPVGSKMELWRQVIANSHHFDKEHDADPDPHLSENLDPEPHFNDADPQPWSSSNILI